MFGNLVEKKAELEPGSKFGAQLKLCFFSFGPFELLSMSREAWMEPIKIEL
jgi:hypothetical protein